MSRPASSSMSLTHAPCTTSAGIVNLSGRGMLLVSVARQLGSGNSFARLMCCPLKPSGAGKRRPRSVNLTMPFRELRKGPR
jgi:hypothetical protein